MNIFLVFFFSEMQSSENSGSFKQWISITYIYLNEGYLEVYLRQVPSLFQQPSQRSETVRAILTCFCG